MENIVRSIEKQERPVPHVQLVVTDAQGSILGTLSAENAQLSQILSMAPGLGFPVAKQTDHTLWPLGQDLYTVSREYVLSVRGYFTQLTWPEIQAIENLLPATAQFSFVVSY